MLSSICGMCWQCVESHSPMFLRTFLGEYFFIITLTVTSRCQYCWSKVSEHQGDQIRRFFASCENVYFCQLFENYRISLHFWATLHVFFRNKSYMS
jgi:hypothetical protein